MCNQHFCRTRLDGKPLYENFARLKAMHCRTIWVPCMTYPFSHETLTWMRHGLPDGFMFQSEFQRDRFARALARNGYRPEQGHLIRGAFFPDEFEFNPRQHTPGGRFVIGKLARPDVDKWSSNHWPILERVPYPQREALCMGWTDKLESKLGAPPPCDDAQRRGGGELAAGRIGGDGGGRADRGAERLGLAGDVGARQERVLVRE